LPSDFAVFIGKTGRGEASEDRGSKRFPTTLSKPRFRDFGHIFAARIWPECQIQGRVLLILLASHLISLVFHFELWI